jgi:hypothetical protein
MTNNVVGVEGKVAVSWFPVTVPSRANWDGLFAAQGRETYLPKEPKPLPQPEGKPPARPETKQLQ